MSDNNNEITFRILCSKEELIDILDRKGYKKDRSFVLDDTYFVPVDTDFSESARLIISKAIILRIISEEDKCDKELVYKLKDIDPSGAIKSQKKYTCGIQNESDAMEFLQALGYKKLFRIVENDIVCEKDGMGLIIKDVVDMGLMMEIETRKQGPFSSIEDLISLVDKLEIPADKSDYFVKKAEIAFNNINGV